MIVLYSKKKETTYNSRIIKFNSNSLLDMVKENMVDNGLEQRESTNCTNCIQAHSQQRTHRRIKTVLFIGERRATINGRHTTVLYYGLASVTIHGLSNLRGIGVLSVLSINWRTSFYRDSNESNASEYFTDNENGIFLPPRFK